MVDSYEFERGLHAFGDQFRAQIDNAGPPSSEHAVHFCLALGFQAAYDLAPGSIVFEKPLNLGRLDLWVVPIGIAVEIKYRRPIPSGRNLPATQLFGSLLADCNKIARADARTRVVVYVSDEPGINYLYRTGRGLLPLRLNERNSIEPDDIEQLPKTAATNAVADGPWVPLTAQLAWEQDFSPWRLLAWQIESQDK